MENLDWDTLRRVVESAPSGLVLVDGKGRIFRVNAEIERLTGWTRSELIGEPIEKLVPPRFRDVHEVERGRYEEKPVRRSMGTGLNLFLLRKDGGEVPVDIGLTPLRIRDRPMVLAAILDATPRHKAELATREAERQAFLSLSRMASVVAHQVNTPLTNIALLAASIGRTTSDSRVRAYTDRIHEQERAAAAIIKNLMSIARIQSLRKEDADLRTVVDEAVEEIRPTVPAAVSLVREYPEERVTVSVDRLQVREILVNLIKNAVEATHGGMVVVRLENGGPLVRISVTDTGVGIPAETMSKLFNPFFTTKEGSGTGLGLVYVKGVVTAHGGTVEVASVPGQGSTFTVVLPAK